MSTKRTVSLDPVATKTKAEGSAGGGSASRLNKGQVVKLGVACVLLAGAAVLIWYSVRPQEPVVSQGDISASPPAPVDTVEVRSGAGEKKQMQITPQMREEYNNQPVGRRWVPPPPQ